MPPAGCPSLKQLNAKLGIGTCDFGQSATCNKIVENFLNIVIPNPAVSLDDGSYKYTFDNRSILKQSGYEDLLQAKEGYIDHRFESPPPQGSGIVNACKAD